MDQHNLICPITQQVYYEPVVADDGYIYEKDAIEEWLESKNISPMTRETISEKVISVQFMKTMVDDYLIKNPQMKARQYIGTKLFKRFQITIFDHIKNHEFNKLLDYSCYQVEKLDAKKITIDKKDKKKEIPYLEYLMVACQDETIITYFIDNLDRINENLSLYMARYSSEELNLKYEDVTSFGSYTGYKWTALHFYVKRNFVKLIEKIGKKHSYGGLHYITKKKQSSLMMAIEQEKIDIVNILLNYKMKVITDDIICAIKHKLHYDIVKKMYDLCKDNITTKISAVAYCVSVYGKYGGYMDFLKHMLEKIIKKDKEEEYVDEEEDSEQLDFNHPLIASLCKGTSSVEIIKLFIDKGFSVNTSNDKDKDGYCGWMIALWQKRFKVFEYMLPKIDFTVMSKHGTSMIHWLAQNAKYKLIKKMLEEHNFNLNEIANNKTPLSYALEHNTSKVCQLLIDKGADMNLYCEDGPHIMVAIKHQSKNFKFINNIISKSNHLEIECDGYYPIHYVCCYGSRELIKMFFDISINLNVKNKRKQNLISMLSARNKFDCADLIKYLIEVKKMDIEEYDILGFKPLHYILLYGSFEMIKYMKKITKDHAINLNIRKSNQKVISKDETLKQFDKYHELADLVMDNPFMKKKVKASLDL